MNNLERTIKILENQLDDLSKIDIEEKKENLPLMLIVQETITKTAIALMLLSKIWFRKPFWCLL